MCCILSQACYYAFINHGVTDMTHPLLIAADRRIAAEYRALAAWWRQRAVYSATDADCERCLAQADHYDALAASYER